MLLYFLLPILCNALLLAACKLPKLAPAGSEFSKTAVRMGILTAGEILVLLLLHALIRGFQITGSHLFPPLPLAITLLLLGAGTAFSGKQDTAVLRKYLRKAACIAGCVFLLEVLVFHITGFTTQKIKEELPLSTAEISDEEAASFNDKGEITITGNCTLTFSDLDWDELHCVRLHADGKDKMYQVSLSMKDNNLTQRFEKTAQTQATGSYDTLQFAMQPYEKIHVLQLQFENIDAPITLHSGTAYAAIPFAFSTGRFLLVLLIALGLTACKQFSVWEIHYQAKNWKHNLAVLVTLFGCLACISAFIVPDQKPTDMHSVDISNVYGKTLEAWTDGHSYMNFDVTPELAELENPYDNSNRDGVSYNWDYAYYNEHYYCYFGCAPVVLIYLPFYAITGKVPTLNFAYCITVAAIIIAIFGLIMTLVRRYDKQPPLLLLLFGLVSAVAGCGAFVGLNYNDRYYLCLLMGMFGLLLALWTGFAAVSVKKSWKRFALLAVSGIGVVITAASRPNLLVYVLLLVPIFLHLLFRKDLRLQNRLISAGCFLLPTLVGAAAIMWYNQIRFDSPLQFGAIYQMTVDNTAANRISLARFPAAFAAYFLHPHGTDGRLPVPERQCSACSQPHDVSLCRKIFRSVGNAVGTAGRAQHSPALEKVETAGRLPDPPCSGADYRYRSRSSGVGGLLHGRHHHSLPAGYYGSAQRHVHHAAAASAGSAEALFRQCCTNQPESHRTGNDWNRAGILLYSHHLRRWRGTV